MSYTEQLIIRYAQDWTNGNYNYYLLGKCIYNKENRVMISDLSKRDIRLFVNSGGYINFYK